jgi:dienelactone hydrolase
MNKVVLHIIFILIVNFTLAQKPVITNDSYKSWPELRDYYISDDGRFVLYNVGSDPGTNTMIIQTIDAKYRKEFANVNGGRFIGGGKYLSFTSGKNIGILQTGSDSIKYISNASDLNYRKLRDQDVIIYKRQKALTRSDLSTGKEIILGEIDRFWMPDNGNSLVYISSNKLVWLNLLNNTKQVIQTGTLPETVNFDRTGNSIVYSVKGNDSFQIRYFKIGMDSSFIMVTNLTPGMQSDYQISQEPPDVAGDGAFLVFKVLKNMEKRSPDSLLISANVDVWSYKDQYIQSYQLHHKDQKLNQRFTALFNIQERKVIQLESPDFALASAIGKKFAVIKNVTNSPESYWNESQIPVYELVNLSSGTKKYITSGVLGVEISADERYVTWANPTTKDIQVFEISSGKMLNLTGAVKEIFKLKQDSIGKALTIAGWGVKERFILLYDEFDIWQVSLTGAMECINLTSNYGKRNKTVLRLSVDYHPSNPLKDGDSVLIVALNDSSKANGFFKIRLHQRNDIANISLHPYLYYFPNIYVWHPEAPIKAKSGSTYILTRQSASEAPNLIATRDFKEFVKLTDIAPQKKYNWMRSELLQWKLQDGSVGKGILYKPENFDSTRTYPLIYHYYELRSNELNRFWKPELPYGGLNIPWYVSNGYLVFVPDIKFRTGHFSEDVVDILTTSVQYLKRCSWININKLGLQGHSFGGFITNMLVAQTNLFAAAQSSAGLSDMIVEYAGLGFGNESLISMVEVGQTKMGASPWENPNIYRSNSVIYTLDKVTTPLLLMHNKEDGAVPFSHSVLMFNSMRRLKKPVWLLQYDGEGHILFGENAMLDFFVRQQQFFNHYLKNAAAPSWMTHELPASFKGVYSGLEMDSSSTGPRGR